MNKHAKRPIGLLVPACVERIGWNIALYFARKLGRGPYSAAAWRDDSPDLEPREVR
jgi:hypothetical protein